MIERLAEPMAGDNCRAEPLTEAHREQLREACAEDPDIWEIYYISYAPEHFDESFDALLKRGWVPFALFDGDRHADDHREQQHELRRNQRSRRDWPRWTRSCARVSDTRSQGRRRSARARQNTLLPASPTARNSAGL